MTVSLASQIAAVKRAFDRSEDIGRATGVPPAGRQILKRDLQAALETLKALASSPPHSEAA